MKLWPEKYTDGLFLFLPRYRMDKEWNNKYASLFFLKIAAHTIFGLRAKKWMDDHLLTHFSCSVQEKFLDHLAPAYWTEINIFQKVQTNYYKYYQGILLLSQPLPVPNKGQILLINLNNKGTFKTNAHFNIINKLLVMVIVFCFFFAVDDHLQLVAIFLCVLPAE